MMGPGPDEIVRLRWRRGPNLCVLLWALIGLIDHAVEKCQWTLVLPPVNVSLGIAPRARWSRLGSIYHSAGLLPRPAALHGLR